MTDNITFELPAEELARGITAVLPHASTEKVLPAICQVHIELNPAAAYLTATDKYTMGRYRIEPAEHETFPRLSVGLEVADAKTVAKMATARAKLGTDRKPIKFEVECGTPAIGRKITVSDGFGNSASFLANEGAFPPVAGILQSAAERARNGETPAACHGYTGKYLSRFEKACDRWNPTVWAYTATMHHPVLVTLGAESPFAGVIMTVKPGEFDTPPALPHWLEHPLGDLAEVA